MTSAAERDSLLAEAERTISAGSKSFRFASNLFDQTTRAVWHLLNAVLDAQRLVGQSADGSDGRIGDRASQGRGDLAAAVAQNADFEVVADTLVLGAADDQ